MAGILISRRDGHLRVRLQGCCGADGHRREYERAFMQQVLEEGGRVVERDGDVVRLVDSRGRAHTVTLA
jgi:hypothetical protein